MHAQSDNDFRQLLPFLPFLIPQANTARVNSPRSRIDLSQINSVDNKTVLHGIRGRVGMRVSVRKHGIVTRCGPIIIIVR